METRREMKKVAYISKEEYEKLLLETKDVSKDKILKIAVDAIDGGGVIYIKYWCQYCGSRQTSEVPNAFHEGGYYCGECGELSKPEKYGIVVILTNVPKGVPLDKIIGGRGG